MVLERIRRRWSRLRRGRMWASRLSYEEAAVLSPGDGHYRAFVGHPERFDLLSASQFSLLCALGLREHHKVLDFGCGCLRAGRLLIPYLLPGGYVGVEPNAWLVEAGVEHQLGKALLRIKRPAFFHNDDFRCPRTGHAFDFILAHSIFSHCGSELIARGLSEFRAVLAPRGVCAVTFLTTSDSAASFRGQGWVYPDCVPYLPSELQALIEDAGLVGVPIAWQHAGQTWYLLAHAAEHLPRPDELALLRGAVLERDVARGHA